MIPFRIDEKMMRPLACRITEAGILRITFRTILAPVFSSFFSTLAPTPSSVKAVGQSEISLTARERTECVPSRLRTYLARS